MSRLPDPSASRAALHHSKPRARARAAWALRKAGDPAASRSIADALREEPEGKVAAAMAWAADALGGDGAAEALALVLGRPDVDRATRGFCASRLGAYAGYPVAIEALLRALASDESPLVRQCAGRALATSEDPRAAEGVAAAYQSGAISATDPKNSVPVARTLELFADDAALHRALSLRIGRDERILAALRLVRAPGAEGGLVALEGRLVVALRQAPTTARTAPSEVNVLIDAPYTAVDRFRADASSLELRAGSDGALIAGLPGWLLDLWRPHLAAIANRVETARASGPRLADAGVSGVLGAFSGGVAVDSASPVPPPPQQPSSPSVEDTPTRAPTESPQSNL